MSTDAGTVDSASASASPLDGAAESLSPGAVADGARAKSTSGEGTKGTPEKIAAKAVKAPAAPGAKVTLPFSRVLAVGVGLALLATFVLPFQLPEYLVPIVGKFICFGIVALAMDLVWGYAGILSLGHGLFFALGGYAMGMYLMRAIAGQGVYRSELPDFMVFLDWKVLPWYWYGFRNFTFAMIMAVVVPSVLALGFGYLAFRSRIRGVYFSIVTQALTYAAMLLFFRNNTGFGGNNGLTDFKRILGYPLQEIGTKRALFVVSGLVLVAAYLLCRAIVRSKFGRALTAVRDAELRVRFLGYETIHYKLAVWTLSAALCGLAGALYVPQAGIINPSEMQPSNSIEMAIWVAVGGRASLIGGILGAWIVNGAKSVLTAAFPEAWLYFLGGLFIIVTLFLPKGLVGLGSLLAKGLGKGKEMTAGKKGGSK